MKAFILRHDSTLSYEYAEIAAESCDEHKIEWEYFEGFSNMLGSDAHKQIGVIENPKKTLKPINSDSNKAQLCTAGHVAIWKHIVDTRMQSAIILEHDAVMLQEFDFNINYDCIVALGYKLKDKNQYNHVKDKVALRKIDKHSGSHAYVITRGAAEQMLDNIREMGTSGCVDQHVFRANTLRKNVPLYIADPVCAIGWIRKSTIWGAASLVNFDYIDSFKKNLS